ncbi:MAG: hypothetical protein AAF608_08270 [Pseudomonadota bacterium]
MAALLKILLKVAAALVILALLIITLLMVSFGWQMRQVNRERVEDNDRRTVPEVVDLTVLREVWEADHTVFDFCHSRVSTIAEDQLTAWLNELAATDLDTSSIYRGWMNTPGSVWTPRCFDDADADEITRATSEPGSYYKSYDYRVDDELNPSWVHHFTLIDGENGRIYQQTMSARPPG